MKNRSTGDGDGAPRGSMAAGLEAAKARLAKQLKRPRRDAGETNELLEQAVEELGTTAEDMSAAEEELRQQREELAAARTDAEALRRRYEELFDSAPDPHLETGLDGSIREANRAASELFGIPRKLLVGKLIVSFVPTEQRRAFRASLAKVANGEDRADWRFPLDLEDRNHLVVEATVAVERTPSGELVGLRWLLRDVSRRVEERGRLEQQRDLFKLMVESSTTPDHAGAARFVPEVGRDVTERTAAEDEFELRKALLESQSEASIEGILAVAPDGRIVSFNRRFVEMWGIPDDVMASRSDEAALRFVLEKLSDPEAFSARVKYLYEHPEERSRDEIRLKDGRVFDRHSAPLAGRGRHYGRVWFFRDVTLERKREEDRLRFLAAEQRARGEAEAAERRLAAQYAVASILADVATLEEAAPRVLETIGVTLGWDLGALWQVDAAASLLRCVDVWRSPTFPGQKLEAVTRSRTFDPGEGLPGRSWRSGKPAWIRDVTMDPNFPRAGIAEKEGVRAGFAFPILLGGKVLGVMEFLSREVREPDERLLDAATATGRQIGQFIQRRQAEHAREELLARERAARETAASTAEQLRKLHAMTEAVAQVGMKGLVRDLLVQVRETLATDTATILLLSNDGRYLEARTSVGGEEELAGPVRVPMGRGIAGRVAAEGQPRIVNDLRTADVVSPFLRERVRSLLAVPLLVGDRLVGVLQAGTFARRQFTQDDLHLLRLVAERAAVAIDNAGLYQSEQDARRAAETAGRRLEFLAEAGALLAGSLSLEEALESLAQLGVGFLADLCFVDLLDQDGSIRRMVALHRDQQKQPLVSRLHHEFPPTLARPTPAIRVIHSGQPEFRPKITDDFIRRNAQSEEHFRLVKQLGFESFLAVPLIARGRVLGSFTLISTDPARRYGDADLQLAQELARRAAVAVDNARLYEAEQRARQRAEEASTRTSILHALTAALSEAVTVADVARFVVDQGLTVLGAKAGSVVLVSESGRQLELIQAAGYPPESVRKWSSFPVGAELPLAESVRTGEPVFLPSRQERDARYPDLAQSDTEAKAWASVPLIVEARAIGALGLSFESARDFSQEEVAFMQALARQCAQAIERARLFESEQRARNAVERAHDRLALLADASEVITSSLDADIVMPRLTRLVVPRVADWCIVDMLEDDGSVRMVGVSHAEHRKEAVARELRRRYPPDRRRNHPVWSVLLTGEPVLAPEVTPEEIRARASDELHWKLLEQMDIRSHMIVPMVARGRTLGAISFIQTGASGRRYGPNDLALAQDLARRAALAVDNARLFQEQRRVARTLQESLLPPTLPEIAGVEVAGRYRPAGEGVEVGGDFYDVFEAGEGAWAVVIGDVCGKGPEAAAITGFVRHTLRAMVLHETRPSRVLAQLNSALLRQITDNRFCTVCYVRLHPSDAGARLTISPAGHPLPFLLKADGSVREVGRPGRLLGVFEDTELADEALDLEPGDALVLYTDGVPEQLGGEGGPGTDRIASVMRSCAGLGAEGIADRLERTVVVSSGGVARDDMAILVIRASGGAPPSREQPEQAS